MSRKRTGLRNRHRDGRSTYSVKGKAAHRDSYATFANGRQTRPDIIAGHVLSYRLTGA